MKYHFIINGYAGNFVSQMREMQGFRQKFLGDMEAGSTIILCEKAEPFSACGKRITRGAVYICSGIYLAEIILDPLARMMHPEDVYIFGSDTCGTELCARAAARAGGSSVTGVHSMEFSGKVTAKKLVYASHMEGTFHMKRGPYCISMARGIAAKEPVAEAYETIDEIGCIQIPEFLVSREYREEEAKEGLSEAKVLVTAGRGAGSKENIQAARAAAAGMGAGFGVSRPAAMNAWAPMNELIGVSGAMACPRVCITAGISGAAAFYAGIGKSEFIVAVNTDEKAPIMNQADVVIVDDFVPVLKALTELTEKEMA